MLIFCSERKQLDVCKLTEHACWSLCCQSDFEFRMQGGFRSLDVSCYYIMADTTLYAKMLMHKHPPEQVHASITSSIYRKTSFNMQQCSLMNKI